MNAWRGLVGVGRTLAAECEIVVCSSDQPTPCVITIGSNGAATSVVVSVFLYDAGAETTYKGAFSAGFMGRGYEARVDYTTTPGKVPTAVTVVGRVTSTPGDYEFRMALLAEVPGHTDPHQFLRTIPVKVAPATSS